MTDDISAATASSPVLSAPGRVGTLFHQALRLGKPGWWRGLLSIVVLVGSFLILNTLLTTGALVFDVMVGNITADSLLRGEVALTPAVMLMNNLSLAALIPVAGLLQWGLHGVRPGRVSSVLGRFRWRWFLRSAIIIVPLWIVYVGASFLIEPLADPGRLTGEAVALLVIVLVTTPLQAAGEEYGARGLLNRAAGSWSADPRLSFALGAGVSSVLFALAHFAADPWLIAYYLVFGVALCFAVTGTGGLEAAVLLHAVNNVLLLVPTVLSGAQDQVFDRGVGTGGPFMLIPMAVCAAAAALIVFWGRRSKVAVRDSYVRPAPEPAAVEAPRQVQEREQG